MDRRDAEGIPLNTFHRRRSSSASSVFDNDNDTDGIFDSRQSSDHHEPSAPRSTHQRRSPGSVRLLGTLGRLHYYESLLERKFGMEGGGSQRILPEDRESPRIWMMSMVWVGATLNLSCFASGLLGWKLGLSFAQTFWTILVGTFLGSAVTGWCAILGPPTGLRQVSISRYSMGWYPARIIAFLNIITALGFSAVSCIAAGYAMTALSAERLPPSFGITLTCFSATFFSVFGLRGVILYEKYAWMVCIFIFVVIFAQTMPQADITVPPPSMSTTPGFNTAERNSAILSLLSASYGACGGWASVTSDFYVQYSSRTPAAHTFGLTMLGLGLSNLIGMTAGALVGATMSSNNAWLTAYLSSGGVGALLVQILHPRFFADVLLILFVLASTGTNCMTIYTGALSLQQISTRLQEIPRFVWTLVFFISILLIAITGQTYLLPLLQNLLATLGYYNTAFFVIVFIEHYVFRQGSVERYDLDAWDDRKRLPVGWAGGAAFLIGCFASALGMDENWFVGPLARMAGGDVGNVVAAGMAAAVYVPVRMWELRVFGK